jgi:hypothetical protein
MCHFRFQSLDSPGMDDGQWSMVEPTVFEIVHRPSSIAHAGFHDLESEILDLKSQITIVLISATPFRCEP